jgi:hypothetical protein
MGPRSLVGSLLPRALTHVNLNMKIRHYVYRELERGVKVLVNSHDVADNTTQVDPVCHHVPGDCARARGGGGRPPALFAPPVHGDVVAVQLCVLHRLQILDGLQFRPIRLAIHPERFCIKLYFFR